MNETRWVEKPPHVDPVRMRHISDLDLFLAMDLTRPGLESVAAAVKAGDTDAAARAWQSYFAGRSKPVPQLNVTGWAQAVAGTSAAREMIDRAETALVRQVDFTDKGLGKSGLYGFHYLGWMSPLSHAYALTGDERYVEGWARLFDLWYEARDRVQGDWPGLDVIWYTLGVGSRSSTIMHALHTFRGSEKLPLSTHLKMLKTVLGGARWMCEEHDAFRYGNWQFAGCGELLQVAGVFPEFNEAKAWEATARTRIEEHLELDFYPDGGHHERCPSYHTMCLEVLKKAAVISEQCLGWRLSDHPRFPLLFDWLLEMTTGAGWAPPFNDSHVVWSGTYMLWGHYFLGRPEYKGLAERVMTPEVSRAALGWLPARPGRRTPQEEFQVAPSVAPAQESKLLPTSKYALLKGGDLYAAINYGPFIGHELEPHSHLAALDFVLAGWGEALAYEAGGPATYDDPLYYDWYRATRAHNTVVVQGRNTAEERDAELLAFAALPQVDAFVACHRGNGGTAHTRTLLFVRPGPTGAPYWFVRDRLEGEGPFEWLLHGRTPWAPAGDRAFRSAEGPGLLVVPAVPERVSQVNLSAGPSRVPDPATRETKLGEIHALGYTQACGEYDVALVPFQGQEAPVVSVASSGRAVVVAVAGCTDLISEGTWVRESGGRLVAAACWGLEGGSLEHGGHALIEGPGLSACGLTCEPGRLSATAVTSAKTALRLRAPGAHIVRLNGVLIPPKFHGEQVDLEIPCAGRYTIQIEMGE